MSIFEYKSCELIQSDTNYGAVGQVWEDAPGISDTYSKDSSLAHANYWPLLACQNQQDFSW